MAETSYKKPEIIYEDVVEIDSPDAPDDDNNNDNNSKSCFNWCKLVIQKLQYKRYDFLQRRRYQRNIRILFKNLFFIILFFLW